MQRTAVTAVLRIKIGRTEYQLLPMKVSRWDRNVEVIKEFGCDLWITVRNYCTNQRNLFLENTWYCSESSATGHDIINTTDVYSKSWWKCQTTSHLVGNYQLLLSLIPYTHSSLTKYILPAQMICSSVPSFCYILLYMCKRLKNKK